MITIREIIADTKMVEDIKGIKIAIQNKNELDIDAPKEVYFGELSNVPEEFMDFEIIQLSQISASSNPKRNGANILLIAM